MVSRSPRNRKRKKSTVSLKTINKLRGGFGIPSIPAGRGAAAAAAISPFARAALKAAAAEAKNFGLEYATSVLKGTKNPSVVDMYPRVMGVMKGLASDVVSGTSGENAFTQVEASKTRQLGGSLPTKEYFTTLETGRPSTRQMRMLARMNGIKTADFYNSEYNAGTAGPTRAPLRMETGFNQKLLVALGQGNWNANELSNIYSAGTLNTPSNKLETSYVQTMNLYRQFRIMNTNSFLSANIILRLWRATNDTLSCSTVMTQNEAFANPLLASQIPGALPVQYQYSAPTNEGSLNMARVLMDPAASPHYSPAWKEKFEEVRMLRKKLKPGEIWNVKEIFSCGAGINLQVLKENAEEHAAAPVGYQWTMEVYGVRCQGVVGAQDNVHIIGTAPCYIQTEILRGHQTVLASSTGGALNTYDSAAGGGGIEDDRYAVRAFTRRFVALNASKKANFSLDQIKPTPTVGANEIYIPVMSDTVVQYAKEAGED